MRVFLSYSRADRLIAEQITVNLEQAGHDVFFDRHDIEKGEDFYRAIRAEIRRANLFLFLISPNSVKQGSFSRTELEFAQQRWANPENRLLGVVIEATQDIPAYALSVDLFTPEGNIAAEVRDAVNNLRSKHRRRFGLRLAAIAAVLAVLAVLGLQGYRAYLDRGPVGARTRLSQMNVEFTDEQFVEHAAKGDRTVVQLFLDAQVNPNAVDQAGISALMRAIQEDHVAVVEQLLNAGADVNYTVGEGHTAVSWAAARGQDATVQTLLDRGAGIDAINVAYVAAAGNGHLDTLSAFKPGQIEQDSIDAAFLEAAAAMQVSVIRFLQDQVSDRQNITSRALLAAAGNRYAGDRQIPTANLLLQLGADVNVSNEWGMTALHHAASQDATELMQRLLATGANANSRIDCNNPSMTTMNTPLLETVKRRAWRNVPLLLDHDADVNAKSCDGRDVLMNAVKYAPVHVIKSLLDAGARVDEQSPEGLTALMIAAADNGNEAVTQLLLERGANVDAVCACSGERYAGGTALFLAAYNQHAVVEVLLKSDANVNWQGSDGQTALMMAVEQGKADMVRVLLRAGADPAVEDGRGRTALTFAKRLENNEILELLGQ